MKMRSTAKLRMIHGTGGNSEKRPVEVHDRSAYPSARHDSAAREDFAMVIRRQLDAQESEDPRSNRKQMIANGIRYRAAVKEYGSILTIGTIFYASINGTREIAGLAIIGGITAATWIVERMLNRGVKRMQNEEKKKAPAK